MQSAGADHEFAPVPFHVNGKFRDFEFERVSH